MSFVPAAMNNKIGIIAGGGQFPFLFAQSAKRQGKEVVIIAHEKESAPELSEVADSIYWVKLGQFGKILKYFKGQQVSHQDQDFSGCHAGYERSSAME